MKQPTQDEALIASEAARWVEMHKNPENLSESNEAEFNAWLVTSWLHTRHYLMAIANDEDALQKTEPARICTLSDLIDVFCPRTPAYHEALSKALQTSESDLEREEAEASETGNADAALAAEHADNVAASTHAINDAQRDDDASSMHPPSQASERSPDDAPRRPTFSYTGGTGSPLSSWTRPLVVLVGVSLLALLCWALCRPSPSPASRAAEWQEFETGEDEVRSEALSDGSVIALLPNTRLRVRYSDALREVDLLNGASGFKPQSSAQRPFLVRTVHGSIQSVGTWFNVALIDGGARVAVVEGRVAIVGAASKGAIEIGEGERAWLTSFGQAERLQPDALLDAHAQVQRSVRYVKGTLADLVDVFNAHNRLPRFIVEGGARAIKVSTTLDLDNPRTLIAALEGDTRVTLVRVGDSIVIRESRRRTDGRGKKIAALSPFIGWRNAFSTGYVSRTTEFVAWQ